MKVLCSLFPIVMCNFTPSAVPSIAASLLDQVEARISTTNIKQVTDEELLSLHSVFGVVLQRALEILEKYPTFTIYTTAKTSRELIEVKGDNDRCYRVFPRVNYCPCQAFKHQVVEKRTHVTCKHIIAARLAQMLQRTTPHGVTADQYLMLLRSMFDIEDN